MLCNFFSVMLMFMQPFFMMALINYIKNGQNELEQYGVHFVNYEKVSWLKWLTRPKQYGLLLTFALMLSQFVKYLIDINVEYANDMLAAKSSNALIALIYEKQLKIYPASNSEFQSGEIINFV